MSSTNRVRFGADIWSKGHRGLEKAHTSQRASIKNMRLYTNGILGPRPLWEDYVIQFDNAFHDTDTRIMCVHDGVMSIASTGRYKNYGSNTTVTTTTDTRDLERYVRHEALGYQKYMVGTLLLDTLAAESVITADDALTDLGTQFSITNTINVMTHQGRAFFWGGGGSLPYRVYYSDSVVTAGDAAYYTITGSDQYFDVGYNVEGVASLGANLLIWDDSGNWTIMQGTGDPAEATFNSLRDGRIPRNIPPSILDGELIFHSDDDQALVVVNGAGQMDDETLRHLGRSETNTRTTWNPADEPIAPVPAVNSAGNTMIIPNYDKSGLHLYNGVWTYEEWDISTTLLTVGPGASPLLQVDVDQGNNKEILAIASYNAVGTTWDVHERDLTVSAPSTSAIGDFSEYAESYANAYGEVILPRIMDPTKQVRVKTVIIDGVTWSQTEATYPAAGLDIVVSDGKGNDTTLTLGPTATPFSDQPNGTETPIRLVGTGAPTVYTSFSDVKITNLVGVGIESVTVEFEISEGPIF